jgi:hypothetical protein
MSGNLNESFVQLPPNSTGVQVDGFLVSAPWLATPTYTFRQSIVLGDPSNATLVSRLDGQGNIGVNEINARNAQTNDSPLSIFISGDPSGDWASINVLEALLDPNTGISLSVNVTNPPKQDVKGAQVPSDAPALVSASSSQVNTVLFTVDTTGYQSAAIQLNGTFVATVSFTASNDGISWTPVVTINTTGGIQAASTNTAAAAGLYVVPTIGRYLRAQVTAYTSGTVNANLYLRQQPALSLMDTPNIVAIGGTAPVTANVAGMLAVGGNVAPGSAPTAYPVLIAGINTAGNTQRMLTDVLGNVAVGGSIGVGVAPTANPVPIAADTAGLTRRLLTDPTSLLFARTPGGSIEDPNFSGNNEALNLVLLELRRINFWIRRLVEADTGNSNVDFDNDALAADPTIFLS